MFPTEHFCSAMEEEKLFCAVIGDTHKDTIYSDLTGRFPMQSYEGIHIRYVQNELASRTGNVPPPTTWKSTKNNLTTSY